MKYLLRFSILAAAVYTTPVQAEISYADILADPDNPALNQQFARERLAGGDAKAALAAVERVLVAEPTNLGARLFRAEVLSALGADLQAEGELRALAALPLPADIKARVAAMQAKIDQRRKRFNTQANLSIGYMENDNAANWPSDNTILLNGLARPTTGDGRYFITRVDTVDENDPDENIDEKTKDDAASSSFSLSSSYDLGSENWRSVFFSAAMNATSGGDTGYLDGETGSFATGLVYKNRRFTVTPRLTYAAVENDYEERLGSYGISGGSLMTQYQAGSKNRITLSLGQTNLRFEDDKKSNDTDTLSGSFGWESRLGNRLSVNLGGFYQDVDARANTDLDKKLSGNSLSFRIAVLRGQYLTLGGSSVETEHDNVYSQSYNQSPDSTETEADGDIREDEITSTNVSYLILGSVFSPKLSNMFLTLNHQASETESNIVGFSQEREVISARLNFSYRF